jgi:hypothetical protein
MELCDGVLINNLSSSMTVRMHEPIQDAAQHGHKRPPFRRFLRSALHPSLAFEISGSHTAHPPATEPESKRCSGQSWPDGRPRAKPTEPAPLHRIMGVPGRLQLYSSRRGAGGGQASSSLERGSGPQRPPFPSLVRVRGSFRSHTHSNEHTTFRFGKIKKWACTACSYPTWVATSSSAGTSSKPRARSPQPQGWPTGWNYYL